jgi:hypothetical protein
VNFDGAPERCQPGREAVDRDTFHATSEDLGESRLIGAAELSGLCLRELALLDGVSDADDEPAFHRQVRCRRGREAEIDKHVAAARFTTNLLHPRPFLCRRPLMSRHLSPDRRFDEAFDKLGGTINRDAPERDHIQKIIVTG